MAHPKDPEYRAIKKCKPDLVKTLSLNLTAISDELCAEDLIPTPVCKEMQTLGVTDERKASQLVENVLHQVNLNPARFNDFIDILKKDRSRSSMVEILESTLKGAYGYLLWCSYI